MTLREAAFASGLSRPILRGSTSVRKPCAIVYESNQLFPTSGVRLGERDTQSLARATGLLPHSTRPEWVFGTSPAFMSATALA